MSVALVTCLEMPEPDADEALLRDAVRARGVEAFVVPWDAAPPPEAHALWVLRSPWNYHHHLDGFLAFAARVAARRTLLNPLHIVRWNARKTYLRDLKQRGVPVVPTAFVPLAGGEPLAEIARTYGWDDVVVKPTVSGGSFGTRRFRAEDFPAGDAFLQGLLASGRAVMVQGYIADVEARGERAVVLIDGVLTHAVRKSRRLAGDDESVSEALPVEDDERALAELALRPYRDRLLYGRVDMVRDRHGVPMVMELELLEPSLFLAQHPPALDRLADAIVRGARAATAR
jgi:glutathione synthase/RimK-type ligase-like ATP-grasp enzyme